MSFFPRSVPANLLIALFVVAGATACSSSQKSSDASGNPEAAADSSTSQSGADQVGSVPEDMLADEKGVEGSGTAANPEASAADPFGDLKEKEAPKPKKEAATSVSEDPFESASGGDGGGSGGSGGGSGGGGKSGNMDTYVVKAGDTLMKIAFHLYGDVDRWKELHEINQEKLKGGKPLIKGMKLRYEAPNEAFSPDQLAHTYEIKKGDTLAGIAEDLYGKKMKYKKLQAYNKRLIKNPNRIFAGFTIFYDITEQEMSEAEAHRAQKAAGGGASVPSALAPPPAAPAPNVATTPSATDNSALPGPGAPAPAPTQQ